MLDSRLLASPPFSKEHQLCADLDVTDTNTSQQFSHCLPGQPCIQLADSTQLNEFLESELWAEDLESLASRLWIMTTPSSANINPLHKQGVKGREIVPTEDPRLHLVWIHDRIFIKPIPRYLMSHTFWSFWLLNNSSSLGHRRNAIKEAALGYLRTYTYLIRHQSDFSIAQRENLRLIPQDVDWQQFCRFRSALTGIKDTEVSGRYQYGELRLTRLNFYAKFLLRKFCYERVHGQYGDYFARLYGPLLFIFALSSTILNAMQVDMVAQQDLSSVSVSLNCAYAYTSRICLIGTVLTGMCFAMLWSWIFLDEWIFTLKLKPWRRHRRNDAIQC